MPRIQKGVSLSPEMWERLKAIEAKTGIKYSLLIERWIATPLKEKYESLNLGTVDCEKESTYHKIGVHADKVKAISFAGYSIEQFKKDKKNWLEAIKNSWCTVAEGMREIRLCEYHLKRSMHLQVVEDTKSFDRLVKKGKIKTRKY